MSMMGTNSLSLFLTKSQTLQRLLQMTRMNLLRTNPLSPFLTTIQTLQRLLWMVLMNLIRINHLNPYKDVYDPAPEADGDKP